MASRVFVMRFLQEGDNFGWKLCIVIFEGRVFLHRGFNSVPEGCDIRLNYERLSIHWKRWCKIKRRLRCRANFRFESTTFQFIFKFLFFQLRNLLSFVSLFTQVFKELISTCHYLLWFFLLQKTPATAPWWTFTALRRTRIVNNRYRLFFVKISNSISNISQLLEL